MTGVVVSVDARAVSGTLPGAAAGQARPVVRAVQLSRARAVVVFAAFALACFFSTLVRAVTATLAPVFSTKLGLAAGQLGLLAGAYFMGFAALQLLLGSALDALGALGLAPLAAYRVSFGAFALACALSLLWRHGLQRHQHSRSRPGRAQALGLSGG